MPSKYSLTLELSSYTAREIAKKPQHYMAFLRTAANNYKYSFADQLLIFAQKPDATACAEIEMWNRLGRWINKGTKGITLLVDRDIPYKLRHVFDLSDTNSRYGYEVRLWKMEDRYRDQVVENLENSFGEIEDKSSFEQAVIGIAEQIVQDNYTDYLEQLRGVCADSFLEDLDEDNLRKEFRDLLVNSVAFQILTRCGFDAAEEFDRESFVAICDFNTPKTLSVIGNASSDISEMVLREIEATVRSAAREEQKNRTFAENEKTDDNIIENKEFERSDEHGTDLQTGGRLPSSEPRSTGEPEDREVWNAAASVSQREPESGPQRDADVGRAEPAPGTDRPGGDGDGGTPDQTDGAGAGRERADEGDRSDEVGSDDEFAESIGGGDSPERTRLQLSGHDFNARNEIDYYYAPDEKNELLRNCLALKHHRKEIAAFFEVETDRRKRGDFIKTFFDNTYVEHILENGERVGYRAYDDLLTIWHGSYLSRDKEDFLPWWRVASAIEGQILLDTWLAPDEKDLISVDGQIAFIDTIATQKKNEFAIPQAAIDYVLAHGSGVSQGKMRIYQQFQKQETADKNIAFLKNEYGTGGYSDPIPESGYWEDHDGKGIQLRKGDVKVLLPWNKVAKRIDELIAADRYLNRAEKEAYPAFLKENEDRKKRAEIADRFNSVVADFNDYERQLHNDDAVIGGHEAQYYSSEFRIGNRVIKGYGRNPDEYVLPNMRKAMERIITENTHLTERAQAVLTELESDVCRPFELTETEKNPPPEPKKEYRFSLGDTVYIGAKEYEILSLNDPISLFDPQFPIITEEMPKAEFLAKVAENPLNDNHLEIVEEPEAAELPDETDREAERAINEHEAEFGADGTRAFRGVPNTSGYDLGFGHLGNGITVWNRLEMEDGDYKTVAHIAPDRTVTIYDEKMPEEVKAKIYDFAEKEDPTVSATQDGKVFKTPPTEKLPVYDRTTEILYAVLHKLNMDDVGLDFEGEELIAFDEDNQWRGKEFFRFLIDESFIFEGEGKVVGIDDDLLADFTMLAAHNGVLLVDNRLYTPWREYMQAKFDFPDAIVLYKIGDFYEVMGDDAEKIADELSLHLGSRSIQLDKRVPMCGFPVHKLEAYMDMLHDRGHDVVLFEDGRGERIDSIYKNEPQDSMPVARIDFLDVNDQVEMSTDYTDEGSFLRDLFEENKSGTRMRITLYRDADGKTIQQSFVSELKEPVPTVSEVPSPFIKENIESDLDYAKELINSYCADEFGQEADFSNLKEVGLAYTTIGDADLETQVNANLVDFTIDRYVAGVLVDQWRYNTLREMCDYLEALDFNELTDYTDEQIELAEKGTEQKAAETAPATVAEPKGEETPKQSEPAPVELAPPPKKVRRDLTPHVLYPEIQSEYRTNFKINHDNIGVGTPLERFYHNLMAISLLHKLEDEHRLANSLEQDILADYVGWGGLSEFFEETNPHYEELKKTLTDDEYVSARESSLTAFFTPPVVIKAIYQTLENMGFKNGNILEPSCGIGNFMGLIPESMSGSKIYGVEIDSISGRIAQQLYQKNNIAVQGFESTELPDSFFDAAVGNVPFGQFKVPDKKYDRYNFNIHDYFFARTLDKVRPGGVIAFITSRFTMDKENPAVRKYIAQRADLLGAIRLPNDTFKSAAGTDVTTDILFLQKRDRLIDVEPDWVHLNKDANGITMNQYFVDNPDLVVGEMKLKSGPFGPEPTCEPYEDQSLADGLNEAIQNIHAEITEVEFDDLVDEGEDKSIPADPSVRNFSYTVVDGVIYYRENSRMNPVDVSVTAENRIKSMIRIRDCVRSLIEYQTEDYPDDMIFAKQQELNELYDDFSVKYGLINSRANSSAFNADSSYFLLCSLEVLDDEGAFVRKADMFNKRTIRQRVIVTSVDTASEALALSLAEKTKVDMPYMCGLTGKTEQEIAEELKGVIFLNPLHGYGGSGGDKYLPADEYLSGNIREKLAVAKRSAELHPEDYNINVQALEQVMPKDLTASEISVRLGSTWLPVGDINEFMWSLMDTAWWQRRNITAHFASYTGDWSIEGKSYDRSNVKAYNTYGTSRINGYKIIEETLNLRDVRIFDYVEDENGRKTPVLNKKETAIAQGKQQLIKEAFAEWIWKDPDRRARLTKLYNEKFNSTRPREYDGSHLNFVGMNPEITLRPHQVNAIAHILYGGNTLLAHVVGAGKTYEMVAAAQESKRLGLCRKSLFVVPNHLTEQWASEYLQLYPSANILVATKKDFETKNRKKFCGRIATGDYDAVIIGHSQFEKIPMSAERQIAMLEQQEREILQGIEELKHNRGERFSIKAMEKARRSVKQKLDKLNDQSRKDDVVTFEELGVDRLFIDEAHYFKNLAAFTKMRNVGGISQTEAMKSSDLYMKCRYLDEITEGRGVVFATGTPISNSMVEMYTMQKYLQYGTLQKNDLVHFDAWASTFGETVTAIELAPEGNGYRAKTRFAKFYNLPELMSMFKEVADIQTADMLHLPVPKANYHNVALKPSEQQKKMVEGLSERAERVRNRMVNSSEDNMLCITNDGRKLALDQRLLNEMLPDSETGKVSACADNVYDIWKRTAAERSTQLVFCDLSTPKGDGHFNVYDDLKAKLLAKGIPDEEIAFVHSAETEAKKKELFGKVRSGQIRVLIGSTQKMGAGTNVQKKLIALHHLDCPWRPADLQQREGRIIRQGNDNPEVDIYTYVTENTFDSYLYQLVESKQKFIGQIMTSKSPVRSAEDVDEQALSYAEIKALCTGNPHIKEKMDLDIDVARLKLLKANHLSQHYALEDKILKEIPQRIASLEQRIAGYQADMKHLEASTVPNEDGFSPMVIQGETFTDKKAAGTEILAVCKTMTNPEPKVIGSYRGFEMELFFDTFSREYKITLKNELRHTTALGTDIFGNIQRLDNLLGSMDERLKACENQLENEKTQLENAKQDVQKPFAHEEELKTKSARLAELNAMLDLNKSENEIVDNDREDDIEEPVRKREERDDR
jgi:N12 class adenine-specific DNA methylase